MTKLVLALLLGAGAWLSPEAMNAQVSVGIRIGPPPRPRVVRVRPVSPGPGYLWLDGYYFVDRGRYRWHDGYWSRPPYSGAVWVGPRHHEGQFYAGYWEGPRGRFDHDHRWDRDRRYRDYDRHH